MSENTASLSAVVQAEPIGFEQIAAAVRGVQRTMQDMAESLSRTFAALPQQMTAAVRASVDAEVRASRDGASRIESIRKELADREARLTLESTEYRIHLLMQEGERMHEIITKNVTDRKQAEEMIFQNAQLVEEAITKVRKEEAERQEALARKEAEKAAAIQRESANKVEAVLKELSDREARIMQDAVDYRVHLLMEEGERAHQIILKTVSDRKQAEQMILRNARLVEEEITRARKEEADRQEALARKEAEKLAAIQREAASKVEAVRKEMADREARITMDAVEHRVHLLMEEGERTHQIILKTVSDRKQAEQMILRNARLVEEEITRIQIQAAEDRKARMASAASTMGMGAGVGAGILSTAIGTSVKQFADFEQQINQIGAVSDATGEELNRLKQAAKDAGDASKLGALQAAGGLTELAKAGFEVDEEIGALPGVLSLARAGGVSVAQAAELAGGALRGFGIAVREAVRVADLMAMAANKSAIDIADLQFSMKYVAPVARSANQSIEEMSTALAIMGNQMIKGEQAGTTIRGALVRLIDPPREASDALQALGIALHDTHGRMLPMSDIIGQLRTATAGLTEAQKNQRLAQIFGTEALSGMLALVNTSPKAFNEMLDAMKAADGAAKRMGDQMNQGVGPAFSNFQKTMEAVGIEMGTQFAPAILAVTKGLDSLLGWFKNLPEPAKLTAAAVATTATAFLMLGSAAAAWIALAPFVAAAWVEVSGPLAPLTLAIIGVSAAIAGLVVWQKAQFDAAERARLEEEKANKERLTTLATAQRESEEIKRLAAEHDELARKTDLSRAEKARLKTIQEQLQRQYPDLARAIEAAGAQHWATSKAVQDETRAKDALIRKNVELAATEAKAAQAKLEAEASKLSAMRQQQANLKAQPMDRATLGAATMVGGEIERQQRLVDDLARQTMAKTQFLAAAQQIAKPDAPAGGKVDRGGAFAGNGKGKKKRAPSAESLTRHDLQHLNTEAEAHEKTTAQKIADLERYKATHKLTADQILLVEARLNQLRKQLAKEERADQEKHFKDLQEAYHRTYQLIEARVAAFAKNSYESRKKALEEEQARLTSLSFAPGAKQGVIEQALKANRKEQEDLEKSHQAALAALADAGARVYGETLDYKVQKVRDSYAKMKEGAVQKGVDLKAIEQLEADEIAKIRKEDAEKKEKEAADARLKTLDGLKKLVGDANSLLGALFDPTKNLFQKLGEAGQLAFDAFHQQIADAVVPMLASLASTMTTQVLPALASLAGGFLSTAGAALGLTASNAAAATSAGALATSNATAATATGALAASAAAATGAVGALKGVMGDWQSVAIGAAIATAAAVIGLWWKGATDAEAALERNKKLVLEIQKLNAGIVKNRQERADAELAIALKEIEDELLERKKAGLTDAQIQDLRLAKQRELYDRHGEEMRQIQREQRNATLELLAELAELEGDKDRARTQRRAKEEVDAQDAILEAVKAGNLTKEQAEQKHQADLEQIRRKYLAEEIADRETALQRQLSLEEKYASARAEYQRGFMEQQRAIGAITDEQLAKSLAEIDRQESEAAVKRAEREVSNFSGSQQEKAALDQEYNDAVQKLNAATFQALRKELDDYKKTAESKYQAVQDAIERERRALNEKKDAEARAHHERMAALEEEEKALNHQLFLIDEQIRKIKERADADRKKANEEDRAKFNAALAQVQLGGDEGKLDANGKRIVMGIDNLTYEGIDAQLQAIQNKRDLEEITAQEALRLQSEIYLKKAALAQKELDDTKITFGERAKAEARKAEAYKAWQAAQLEMIDQRELAETKVLEASKTTLQHQMADLNAQKEAVQNKLNEIDAAYRTQFEALQRRYDENKLAWDKMLDGIKTGTDTKVKEIVAAYKPLEDRLVSLIAKANELALANARAAASGGGGITGGSYTTAAQVAERGAGGGAGGYRVYATGGYVRGGIKGVDSVPITAQDGEYVLDTSITERLQEFLSSWRSQMLGTLGGAAESWHSLLLGAQRNSLALAGGGGVTVHAPITIRDVAVRSDSDLDLLAEKVTDKVSERIARDWYR